MQLIPCFLFLVILNVGLTAFGNASEIRWAVRNVSYCTVNTTSGRTNTEIIQSGECSVCTLKTTSEGDCNGKVYTIPASQTCTIAATNCLIPKKWEDKKNWEPVGSPPVNRIPCKTDIVVFLAYYTVPRVVVSTKVSIFELRWQSENSTINTSQHFIFQDEGMLKIDQSCREISPCTCSNTSLLKIVIVSLMIVLVIVTGVVFSTIALVFLVRKYFRAKKRKSGEVFTFQTLDEIDNEDEADRFDVMAVNSVEEFPSGKSRIPPDLTALLDEDCVNGNGQTVSVKNQTKKVSEDKQALLNDQDEVFLTEDQLQNTSYVEYIGQQTDL